MKTLVKTALISGAACASLAISPTAFAGDSLEIQDFIGSINWSNGALNVDVQANKGETTISGTRTVKIDGGVKKIDGSECKSIYGRFDFDWFGKNKEGRFGGYENLEDYPVLNITIPKDATLIIRNSIIFTEGAPAVTEADLDLKYCGHVTLGDVENTLALNNRGSADVTVEGSGQIAANLAGSGDLSGADSGDVLLESNGSGDVELGNVRSLEARLRGSGDLQIGDVMGAADLSSRGSGDVDLNDVTGDLAYSSFGSGDLEAASVTGTQMDLQSNGSGDIRIDGGAVIVLNIAVRGSATAEFSGSAKTATLSSSGSGDIRVDRVSGAAEIKTFGSGDVDIDERG